MAASGNSNQTVSKLAREAVNYAQSKITKGSSNRWADYGAAAREFYLGKDKAKGRQQVVKLGETARCLDDSRKQADLEVARLTAQNKTRSWSYNLEAYARAGTVNQCGNCEEFSAMAFIYLRDVLKVKALDWMDYNDGEHAFVIIGRDSKTVPTTEKEEFAGSAVNDWNTATVMCDAYKNVVLNYQELRQVLLSKSKIRERCRFEG